MGSRPTGFSRRANSTYDIHLLEGIPWFSESSPAECAWAFAPCWGLSQLRWSWQLVAAEGERAGMPQPTGAAATMAAMAMRPLARPAALPAARQAHSL